MKKVFLTVMMGCVLTAGATQPVSSDEPKVQPQEETVELRSDAKYYLVLELFDGLLKQSIDDSYQCKFVAVGTDGEPAYVIYKDGVTPLETRLTDWMAGKVYFSTTIVGNLWNPEGPGWWP